MKITRYGRRRKTPGASLGTQGVAQAADWRALATAVDAIAQHQKASSEQSGRADRYHRRMEKQNLRLERRKFRLEKIETAGLWFAGLVGLAAIVVSSIDSHRQTKVMQDQLTAMQGQLGEMKGTGAQTDQMIETSRQLAEAARTQAEAAVETVNQAQASMVASQRAWVGPRNARTDSAPEIGKELTIFVDYQNSGREPASETIFDTDLFVTSVEDEVAGKARSRILGFLSACKIKWTPTNAIMVYPATGGFSSGGYALSRTLPDSDIDQDLIDGKKTIVVSGCFVYKTVATIHRSSFCYFFNSKKSKPGTWNICDYGNDAD